VSENILRQICKAQHLVDSKQYKPARKICLKLLKHPQGKADANFLLGVMLLARQDHHAACKKFRQTLQQLPEHAGARINLLACYRELGQLDAMLALARQFHQQPLSPIETFGAYRAYLETCHWHEADTLRDNVVAALKQGAIPAEIISGTLIHMNETPDISRDDLFQIHRQWGKMVTEAGAASTRPFPRPAPPHNKIKIAYLSVDFNKHPVGYFALPVILGHNRDRFEVFCYAHILKDDETTATFRQAADHFIDISALTAPQAAARIARDGIHILVDLSGHTANSPLPIMAYQPAPVQISYLGYPNTTGLDTVDFRISDEYCEAGGGTLYTEQLLNMPSTFLCLLGMPDVPHSETTPAEHNGFITFGSFNHIRKINPQVIHTWARIMQQVEHSRMLIKSKGCDQDMITNNILQEFERHNIARDRIRFAAYSDLYKDHAALFDQVDITLDTFPYHGTHTTCDALWMSLPVVTLAGDTHVQRVSASILKCIGFDATIASTEDEYIEKAVSLASQPEKLSILRQCTHTLFKNSLILNPAKVIAQLEEQYLKAWAIKMGQPAFIEVQPALTELTMNHDIAILTPRDLKEISTYALTEQGDWYEDELRFLRHIAKPGMRVLDCSAEYGCYSLSLAKEVGADGAVLALNHAPNKQQAIAESARKNTFGQLHTGSSNDASSFLQTGADIIIHAENGIDSNSILFALPDALSPIVMIKAMDEHGMDEALTTRMQQQGFAPYRLIPSLHLLVPVPPEFTPLSWHRQVFFCKQDRAEALASEGFLLLHELESIDLPDDLSYWQHAIEGRSFAKVLLPLWIEQVQTGQAADDWEQVRNALSAYAMAHNQESSSQQRYACLSAALNILLNTEQLQSSIARLCTLARIASELGNYTTAIQAAQMVHEGIITLEMFSPDEPFLPIAGSYDQDDYKDNIAEWVLAQSIAQTELLQHPTSFGDHGAGLLNVTEALRSIGAVDDTLGQREALMLKRMQADKAESDGSIAFPEQQSPPGVMLFDRLAPDMWRMLRAYYDAVGTNTSQRLILAVPNNEDRDKIATYLQTTHQIEEAIQPQSVQIVVNHEHGNQRQFLHHILQQCAVLHVPESSSSKLQDMAVDIANSLETEVVWHDEKSNYMPKPLPPVKDFRVTIMLTTYNRVKLLKRAVESILKQTYNDFVLVILDDASTDGTEEYCKALAQNYSNVDYRRNKVNLGPGVNGGDISWVETELMMGFADDDFLLSATALEKMVDAFHQHPQIGVAFGQCHIGDVYAKQAQATIPMNCTTDCILDAQQMLLDSIAGNQIYGAGRVFRKAMCTAAIQYSSEHWGKTEMALEGDYLAGLIHCISTPVAYVHIPAVYYSLWSETVTSSQLGGSWSMNIRLRTVAYLDDMYIRHFGHSQTEHQRIQQMVDVFDEQHANIKHQMSDDEFIEHKDELEYYNALITCIRQHQFPEILRSTNLF